MADAPYELSVERTIAAPPEKVWEVITERLDEWWCPKPWRTEIAQVDWQAGGALDVVMKGPDGEENKVRGIFLEVVPAQKFVFTDAITPDKMPQEPFIIGVFELADNGADGTNYRAAALHWSEEAMEKHKEMGFEDGWGAVADQLAALCEG